MPDIKQSLRDFVATSNSGKYKSEQELLSKFPEFKDYDVQLLRDFVATSNSGKYKTEAELLSKFPEFSKQPVRQEAPASIAKPVPSTVAKPVPMQSKPQQQPNVGERIVQEEVGKAQLEQTQAAPQPKQISGLQGVERQPRNTQKPFEFFSGTSAIKETPAQPPIKTWQQASDIAVSETSPDITFEQFQQKRQAQQPFSLGGMLKSDRQKAFEQESEMLKRYADVYDFNAQQAATNFQTKFGLSIDNAQTLEAELQPFFTKQNQIDAELKGYEAQWQQASAIPDETARSAAQDRIKAEFNVKVGELNTLETQYKDKLDAYRFYADSPEYSIYKDLKGKSTEAKNRRAQLPLDERYKDVTQDIGELEGLANAYTRGMQNAEIADILAAGRQPTIEELRRIAQIKREQEGYKVSDALERFNNASGFKESAKAFISNPLEITSQWVTESLVAQLSHGLTRGGAGALTGAAIGSVVPVGGTAVGAGLGFATGMGLAGYNLEYSSAILESLQEAGIDITDEESLIDGFSDPKKMAEAKKYANLRGVPIGIIDAATGGLVGKISKSPIKSATKKALAEFGTEVSGAGVGEATAQILSKGELNGKELFAEMIGEVGGGAPNIAVSNTLSTLDAIQKKRQSSNLKGEQKSAVEAQMMAEMRNTDVPVETFNEVVDLHEGAGLIEPQAADELKSQYEQAQANKPVETMQDELQVGDTVEMSPEVSAPTEVVAEEQVITEPIKTEEDAVQEQTTDEGVLRQERPELELQGMEQRDPQQEIAAQESQVQEEVKPVTDEKTEEISPELKKVNEQIKSLESEIQQLEKEIKSIEKQEIKEQASDGTSVLNIGKDGTISSNMVNHPKGQLYKAKKEGNTLLITGIMSDAMRPFLTNPQTFIIQAFNEGNLYKEGMSYIHVLKPAVFVQDSNGYRLVNKGIILYGNSLADIQENFKNTQLNELIDKKNAKQRNLNQLQNTKKELQKPVTDGETEQTAQEPLLEGVRDGGAKAEAGQESPELRAEKQEVAEELSEWELAGKEILENQGENVLKDWITNQPLLSGFKRMRNLANKIGIRFPQTEKQFDEEVKKAGGIDNYGNLIFSDFLQYFIGISDYNPRKSAENQNSQIKKAIENTRSLLDDIEGNAKWVAQRTNYKIITEKNAKKIGKSDLSEHIGKYYFSTGAKITIKTPKQLVNDYVSNKVKDLQKNIISERAIEASERRVAEIKEKRKQEQPQAVPTKSKQEVAEEKFTVNKTDYIKRGDEYFSKPSKGKENPITQKVFENAKAKVKQADERTTPAPAVSEPVSKAATEAKPQAEKGVGETVQQDTAATRPTATERTATDVEATDTEQPKALKGKEKIGEGVDILASAIGAKKNFTPEQKPEILKGLRLIAEGIAEELGIKGKELYAKLKEKLSELGYKDIADNLDSIKDEIRDDFKDIEPPKQEPPTSEAQKGEGKKVTSIGKRLAMTMPELMDDANLQYTPDRWDAVIKKAEAFLSDMFYDSKGKPLSKAEVLKNAREVLDMINSINFGSASEMGGTLPMFMLIYMRGVAKQTNNTEMQRLVEYQMAQTSRMAGQVIASMRALVESVGRAAEAATLADGVIRETLAKATENGIQDLNETIEALTEALKLKQSEIDTLNKALEESAAVEKAADKAVNTISGKVRKTPEPTTEAGKIRKAIREKRAAMLEKYGKKTNVGFAALNDERKQYIKDLIDIIVDYAKLGIESPKEFIQEFLDLWEKGTGESGDALWADIMGDPDFQAKEQEAKLDWVAKKVQGAIERAIKGQNPKATNQDKMLNAIARALVSQVRSQNKPTNKPDTKLEDAVEVIKNRELTAESAYRAMNLVKASIETMKDSAGNPLSQTQKDALLLQAEDLISAMSTDGLPMAVIRSEIAKGLKSLKTSMRELAVAHYSEQQDAANNIRQTLEDKLVGLGLSRTDAANYADAVQAEFMAKLGEAQVKKVQSIMNPTKKQAENVLVNMLAKAYNAGGVNAVDAVLAKRNLGILTNAEINALGNAQNNNDVKAVFDKKIKDERVQAYLNRARKSTKTTVSQDLLKFWNGVKGAKDAVAAMVKRAKGSNIELAQEDIDVLESGDIDAITSMFEEKVAVKELMTAYGRKADGSKRTRPARKNTTQRMLELIEAGMVNGETARNLFAEKFGLGSLTEVDTEFITNAFEQLQFFKSGEIAAKITKDIEDYMEAVKIKAGGVPRLIALQTAISNMIIKSVLTGFGSMTGAITQGTIVGNMLGIPAHTIASKIRSKMAVRAAMEVVKDQFKGVVMSDIINTMKTGIPSLESKAMKERFDAGGGDAFDYLTKAVDNMEIDGVKSLLQWLMLKPTTQFYKLSRYTIAADLIGTHPVSELLTAQMLFENAVENEYGGIAPEQGSDAWKNLISAIQDKMGYNKMAEYNAVIDEEIKQAKVLGIPLDSGYRVRRQKALATEQRDAAIVEWAMDTARSMQLQENPKDGFIGGVVNTLRGFKLSEKWAKKMPVSVGYGLAASMLLFRTSVFLLPRIMMVAARAITYGTPVVGTGLALRGLIKADTRGASMRYGTLLTMNIASLAYLTAGVLSMLDLDDDDEDETEVKFAGLKLKIKKSPPVSFYGEDISEWNKEPLKIKVGDEMIARPEVAIQFGNRRPLTMRYAPWFLVNHVLLSKILEKAQYAVVDVNKVTGEKTVELQSISLADLGGAVISALGAGTLDIAFENLDRVARNAKGVFGKEESQIVKDRAYTDLMYTAMNPIKLALRPKALQEVSLSIGKGLSVLKGEEYKEQKPTNMVEAAVKDLGFGLITPFNDIMDTYNYDEYGMSRPKTLSAPKGINSWISVVDNIVADTPRLPENWDSEYAEQRANGRLPKISEGRSVAIPMVDFKSTMMQPEYYGMKDYTIEQRAEINRMIRLMQSDLLLDAPLENKTIKELNDDDWVSVIKDFKSVGAEMAIGNIMKLHIDKYGDFSKNNKFAPLPFDVELIRKANDKLEKDVMKKNLK